MRRLVFDPSSPVYPIPESQEGTLSMTHKQMNRRTRNPCVLSYIWHEDFRSLSRLWTLSRSCYPPWNLKRGGLESPGQRLISSIGKKIFSKCSDFMKKNNFMCDGRTEIFVSNLRFGDCVRPWPVNVRPSLIGHIQGRKEYIETTVEGRENGGRKRDEGKTGAVKWGGQGGTTEEVLSRLNRN